MQKKLGRLIGIAVLVILAIATVEYFYYRQELYPTTDDAYVKANFVKVASLVNGKVDKVFVEENGFVKKGETVFTLKKSEYEFAVAAAKAKLALAHQKLAAANEAVATAESEVEKLDIELKLLQDNTRRTLDLVSKQDLSQFSGKTAIAKLKSAEAAYAAAQHKLAQAKIEAGQNGPENALIQEAQANYERADYELAHTTYTAPISGMITNLQLHIGDLVSAGQPLFVIIGTNHFWIEANFSEKNLARLKIGQPATVNIDMFPKMTFNGKLKSISHGSGDSFSLLPSQNASGNWVKVARRFPVLISVKNPDQKKYPVRVGASCEVSIDTRDHA